MNLNPLTNPVTPLLENKVNLQVTHDKHFINSESTLENSGIDLSRATGENGFYESLINTLSGLNDQIVDADKISEDFIARPDKVNVHDVMIALQKSKISLDLTRSVIQKSIEGYKAIINLR